MRGKRNVKKENERDQIDIAILELPSSDLRKDCHLFRHPFQAHSLLPTEDDL
jgi:hypothetical protein